MSGVVAAAAAQQNTFDDVEANVTVKVTPQISSDGVINLQIYITVNDFTSAADAGSNGSTTLSAANRTTRVITTNASLGNREILAVGGLVRGEDREMVTKVPVLGDIPLLGWMFKNKRKERIKNNLLVFISPRLIEPQLEGGVNTFSARKVSYSKTILKDSCSATEQRDPIHRWFFNDKIDEGADYLDNFIDGKNPKFPLRDYREPCLKRCDECSPPPANRKKVCNTYDYRTPCLDRCTDCDTPEENTQLCKNEETSQQETPLAVETTIVAHTDQTSSDAPTQDVETVVVAENNEPNAVQRQEAETSQDDVLLAQLTEMKNKEILENSETKKSLFNTHNALLVDRSKKNKRSITHFLPQQKHKVSA